MDKQIVVHAMNYYSAIKRNNPQNPQCEWIWNALCQVKETRLKMLCTVWFHLFDIMEKIQLQAYLVLLCFALPRFTDTEFFTNCRFVATLHRASLSVPFFPTSICSFYVFVIFWWFSQYFKLFIIVKFIMVICDQWSLTSLLQLTEGSDNG